MAIDFSLRDFFDPLAILRMRRNLERTQWMSEEELRAYQDDRLRRTVRHCARHVPYYRHLFHELGLRAEDINSADDLHRLPRLSRETVREGGSFIPCRQRGASIAPFWRVPAAARGCPLSSTSIASLTCLSSYTIGVIGDGQVTAWVIGSLNSPQYTSCAVRDLDGRIFDIQRVYGRLLLNSMRLTRTNVGEYSALLERFQPLYVKGLPSALYHLATLLAEPKIAIAPLRAVFSSGENVTR